MSDYGAIKKQAREVNAPMQARLGRPPRPATIEGDNITSRVMSFNAQLTNHLQRMGNIIYRIAPRCEEACDKETEPQSIMQAIEMIQHKLHRLETLEEEIARLI